MKHKHILFGLLALIAASCTNDEMNEVAEMKQNGIQVTADFGADTRIDFSEEANVTHVFWNEGDQITIYDEAQGGLDYQVASVSNGGATANFIAVNAGLQETAEGATVNAIYPALPVEDGIVKLPNTNVWNEDRLVPYATALGIISDSKLNLNFGHSFAYLKLTLNAETVASSDVKTIHAVYLQKTEDLNPLAFVNGIYNTEKNNIVHDGEGANSIHFSLNEPFTATGDAEKVIYIPILPQSAGETLTLSILHHDDYGVCDTLLTVSKQVPESGFTYGNVYTYSPKQSFTREGNTITLTEAGTLSQAISEEEKYAIKDLKIIGPLNGDDILFIREMAGMDVDCHATKGVLTHLDISEATIVEGGGVYRTGSCYTSNDVIGDYMFYDAILQQVLLPESVTSIGSYAFNWCSSLISIDIPDGVTSIGVGAFSKCSSLTSIDIPDSVTEIGSSAFSDCSSLTSINIPDGVTLIGSYTFSECSSLTSINIPDGVTEIGESAFEYCSSLTSINIPDGVTEIGESAFEYCSSLASINIPDGVTEISESAFEDCSSLASIVLPNGVTKVGPYAFERCHALTSIDIPDSVTEIGYYAFYECSVLTSVMIGDGVISIGSSAFEGCPVLTSVTIGTNVTEIGEGAFEGCSSLTSIDIPNSVTVIRSYAFRNCSSLTSIDIPDGVTWIGSETFGGCSSLTSVDIPDSVSEIRAGAFEGCSSLISINIPNGVTEIEKYTFSGCSSLPSINIPDGVTSIGNETFYSCSSLTSINIPDGVTEIGYNVFKYCSSLAEVICNATTPPTLGYSAFDDIASPSNLYVPAGSATAYSESDWAQYFTTIEEK